MTDEVFESPMAKAVYVAGGQSSLAKKVGVTQGAVWKWVRGVKKVSPVHAVAVSNAVNWKPFYEMLVDVLHKGEHHASSEFEKVTSN